MEGLEKYGFKYKDGRPLEDFSFAFICENVDDFECPEGHLRVCADFERIIRERGVTLEPTKVEAWKDKAVI